MAKTRELIYPKNILNYLKTLKANDEMRQLFAKELVNLVLASRKETQ